MDAILVVIFSAIVLLVAAIAISANRTLARGSGKRRPAPDLGYIGSSRGFSDTDAAENAYLESRLAGYNPDGTASDPDALRKLAEEEDSR